MRYLFSLLTKNLSFKLLNLNLKRGNAAAEDYMIFSISITPKKNNRSFAHHFATWNVYDFRMHKPYQAQRNASWSAIHVFGYKDSHISNNSLGQHTKPGYDMPTTMK